MHEAGQALEVYRSLRGGVLAHGWRQRRTVMVLQSNQLPIAEILLNHYGIPRTEVVLVHISDGMPWQESNLREPPALPLPRSSFFNLFAPQKNRRSSRFMLSAASHLEPCVHQFALLSFLLSPLP